MEQAVFVCENIFEKTVKLQTNFLKPEQNKFSHIITDDTFSLDVNIDLTATENNTTEIDHQTNLE
jgi:hypothetical protein